MKRLPSEARTAWLGRYLVGCPGTGFQVLPASTLRNRPALPITETPANNVWLGLPAAPLFGSKTTKTMLLRPPPLHAGSFASSGESCSTSAGKLATLDQVTAPSALFQRPALRVPRKRMRPSL